MLLNAEGLPIEHIDRIQVTLNPLLYPFINKEKRNIDPKKYIQIHNIYYYFNWWFLEIQAQKIYPQDIRASIARAISTFIINKAIDLPILKIGSTLKTAHISPYENYVHYFVYKFLEYFVYEVREIEFYFDFEPNTIQIIQPEAFKSYKNTIYSPDYRSKKGISARKSFIKTYDRRLRLKHVNQLSHKVIESNPFSQRIEFTLTKYNCPYRSLIALEGSYHDVITRYIPYLATLYNRILDRNITIQSKNHPYFTQIVTGAQSGRTRYTGELKKQKTVLLLPQDSNKFWEMCFKHHEDTIAKKNQELYKS